MRKLNTRPLPAGRFVRHLACEAARGAIDGLDTTREVHRLARIDGIDVDEAEGYTARILAAQAKIWGAALLNHKVYARRPDLFKAVRGMFNAVNRDKLLDERLVSLINRRVAGLNGCVF